MGFGDGPLNDYFEILLKCSIFYFAEFRPEFLPYTEGIHLYIRHENHFTKDDAKRFGF